MLPSSVNEEMFTSAQEALKKKITGMYLLYSAVFFSAVWQNESAICIPVSPLLWISFQLGSPHSIK